MSFQNKNFGDKISTENNYDEEKIFSHNFDILYGVKQEKKKDLKENTDEEEIFEHNFNILYGVKLKK